MSRTRWPLPTWKVAIAEHTCERWNIPAQTHTLPASTAAHARLSGIREAHRQLELPCWKPLIRISWPHSQAKRLTPSTRDNVTAFSPPPRQRSAERLAA
jgi:hypothetical protein